MSTEVAGRERRRIPIRAPLTGLVLVLIVVFGTYYGWQAAFGADDTGAAGDGCPTTTPATTTTAATTVPPGTTAPPGTTTASVVPAGAVTTVPGTTTTPPDPNVLQPADVTVNVFNATVRRGLANNTAAVLRERGFHISAVQNDPLEAVIPGIAEIRAAALDSPEVRLLLQHVPGAVVVVDSRTDASVDLVLGETFVALGDPATVTPVPIDTPRC